MRKNYIDNIRITCILLLFPFHTCRIFTEENFYVHIGQMNWCDALVRFMSPWFMPILFLLAGMSSYLSLAKRTKEQYIKERVSKLLIPCISGVLLTVPIQTYYAERYHNHFSGSYLEQLGLFFTKETDLSGYTGGFTPAHLWFLLVLFLASIITLPAILKIRNMKAERFKHLENPLVLFMILFILIASSFFDIAGEEIIKYLLLLIIGAVFCANEKILDTIREYRRWYLGIMVITSVLSVLYSNKMIGEPHIVLEYLNYYGRGWSAILAILGYGMKYYNGSNKVLGYFRTASFPIYEVHQTVLVVVAYYVASFTSNFVGQYLGIIILTFILSIIVYEVLRRFKVTRWLSGMKV